MIDLESGKSRRRLSGHPAMHVKKNVIVKHEGSPSAIPTAHIQDMTCYKPESPIALPTQL